MSRHSRQKTTRVPAELIGNVPSPRLQVTRRNLLAAGRGNTRPIREANALADAFGVGTELVSDVLQRRADKAELAGTQAALEGRAPTDEEKRSDRFTLAHNEVLTRAQMTEVEIEMANEWANLDTTNWTSVDTQRWASGLLLVDFGGLDVENDLDVATMALIQPWAEQQELNFLALNQAEQGALMQRQLDVKSEENIRKSLADESFDLDDLNLQIVDLYGGKQANQELFALLRSIAVEDGRPELIEELMKKKTWGNGKAPAPGAIRAFDDKLINALHQARAAKQYNEQIGEREALNLHNKEQQKAGNDVMNTVVQDDNPTAALVALNAGQKNGTIDWQVAAKLRSAIQTYRNLSLGDAIPQWDKIWALELDVASGDKDVGDVITAGDIGTYGTGRAAQQQFTSAMARARAVENFRNNDPLFQSQMQEFAARYTLSLRNEQTEPRVKQHRAKAIVRLLELMESEGTGTDDDGKVITLPGLGIDEAMLRLTAEDSKLRPKTAEEWAALFAGSGTSNKIAIDRWNLAEPGYTASDVWEEDGQEQFSEKSEFVDHLIRIGKLEEKDVERFEGEL